MLEKLPFYGQVLLMVAVGLLILGMGLSFASAEITALQVLQQIHLSREIILNILIPTLNYIKKSGL